MSAPRRNEDEDGRDDGAEEACVVAAAGDCARIKLDIMRQTTNDKAIERVRMSANQTSERRRRRATASIVANAPHTAIDVGSGTAATV